MGGSGAGEHSDGSIGSSNTLDCLILRSRSLIDVLSWTTGTGPTVDDDLVSNFNCLRNCWMLLLRGLSPFGVLESPQTSCNGGKNSNLLPRTWWVSWQLLDNDWKGILLLLHPLLPLTILGVDLKSLCLSLLLLSILGLRKGEIAVGNEASQIHFPNYIKTTRCTIHGLLPHGTTSCE